MVWHNFSELSSVLVSFSIFFLNWYSFRKTGDRRVLFLGVAFFIIGTFDYMHTFSFPGMPAFFSENSTGKAIDFWIVARLTQAFALVFSDFKLARPKNDSFFQALLGIGAFTAIGVTFYVIIYLPHSLPSMYVQGTGLTPTKIWLEYTVVFIALIAFGKFANIYRQTRSHESRILLVGTTFLVFSELFFTLYASAYDIYNLLGHVYKLGAMSSIFGAFFVSGVREPIIRLGEQVELTKRQIKRITALREIDTAIVANLDLGSVLTVVLNRTVSLLTVDAAAVLLLGPDRYLRYANQIGFKSDNKARNIRIRLGTSYAGLAALEGHLVKLGDLNDAHLESEFTDLMSSENFSSYFAVPLSAKGQTVGVLEVYSRSLCSPDEDWREFFETIAQQAAIAINSAQLFDGLRQAKIDLETAYEATLEGWVRAIDMRDHEIEGHSKRVTEMILDLANSFGLTQEKLIHLGRGALLHDIGKLRVPDAILLKPGKLTDDEWEIMRNHPIYAYHMLSQIAFLEPALEIPYCHHEKWDGTGYPRGLKGKEIPLAARLFTVVDVWDALRSDRPYRKAWSKTKALKYMKEQSGKFFDPEIVDMFLKRIN
ncbi:MAG: HD domain-containing protein [Chloroflexi bacterium]|nr:HD domain-containing protein [Chloroflexota bacterium]